LLVVPLQMLVGWRWTFGLLGLCGAAWAVVWQLRFAGERSGSDEVAHERTPWGELFRQRQIWLICVMYFCYAWGSWFFFGWFPTWLVRGEGFSEAEMGVFAALPFLAGTAGNVAGGFLSDRMVSRYGLKMARRLVGSASLTVSCALLAAMTITHNRPLIGILSSLCFGVADLMLPTAWALCLDIGGEHAGVVTGMMNSAGQFGGFACSVVFGYVVQATGNYNYPLWGVSFMVLIAAALFTRIDASKRLFRSAAGT